MPEELDPRALKQIGRYPVTGYVAQGAMGWVFKVSDPSLFDAPRALKLLKPTAEAGGEAARFEREASLLARLQHPNLLRIYEFGQDESSGLYFYTMDFIEGQTLEDLSPDWLAPSPLAAEPEPDAGATVTGAPIEPRKLTLEGVCGHFLDVLAALARLHREGVVHRDVKPANIFVTNDGYALLGDLGIAKVPGASQVLTRAGFSPGTPLYMAPEHAMGAEGARSDLFSLGLTMYRVLTGETIYDATQGVDSTSSEAVLHHLRDRFKARAEFEFEFPPQIPRALADVVRRACRLNDRERYRDARAMSEALRDAMVELRHGPTMTAGSALAEEGRQPLRMPWRAIAVTLGAVALVGLAFAVGPPLAPLVQSVVRFVAGDDEGARLQASAARQQSLAREVLEWAARLQPPPPPDLLREAKGMVDRGAEDLGDAEVDRKHGRADSSARLFARAEARFVGACDRIADDFLIALAGDRTETARETLKSVHPLTESQASAAWAGVELQRQRLDREVPASGCERAQGLGARIDAGEALVRDLVPAAQLAMQARWPGLVEGALAEARGVSADAREGPSDWSAWRESAESGDASLKAAQKAAGREDWAEAYDEAVRAREQLEVAREVAAVWRTSEATKRAIAKAEREGLPTAELRERESAADALIAAGGWGRADELLSPLQQSAQRLLEEAEPAIATRNEADEALREAAREEVEPGLVGDLREQYEGGLASLRERDFASARRLFQTVASRAREAPRAVAPRPATAEAPPPEVQAPEVPALEVPALEVPAPEAPAKVAAAPAAPPPGVGAEPPSSAEAAVLQTLRDYEVAYESLDIRRLNTVWRMSPKEKQLAERDMRECANLALKLDGVTITRLEERKAFVEFDQFMRCRGGDRAPRFEELSAELVLAAGVEWQIRWIAPRDAGPPGSRSRGAITLEERARGWEP